MGTTKLRITVVSPFLDRQHGTELCVVEQIERLAGRYQWKVHLYSQRVEQVKGIREFNEDPENADGSIWWHKIPEIPGPHLVKYLWWFVVNPVRRKRDRRSRKVCTDLTYSPGINCLDADVIVVHIVFREFYARVSAELALNRTPIAHWPRSIHRELYYKLIMWLEERVYREPSVRLIAVSTLVAEQLQKHYERADVTVIPNAVDSSRFNPEARLSKRDASRKLFEYSDSDFVVLLIGNDWKKKGVDALLRAIRLVKNRCLRLLLVGSDDPGFYDAALGEMNLRDRVRFEKPSADVLGFYSAADVYAGPSLEDAFNLPILEAMACGLPVVGSARAGASESIRDGETGLLLHNPQDHIELAGLIGKLVSDEKLRSSLGEAAAHYARTNCTWEQNVEKTREILEELLRARSQV